jgi:hypothetical protein
VVLLHGCNLTLLVAHADHCMPSIPISYPLMLQSTNPPSPLPLIHIVLGLDVKGVCTRAKGRWQALNSQYKDIKTSADNPNATGRGRCEWVHWEQMDAILGGTVQV